MFTGSRPGTFYLLNNRASNGASTITGLTVRNGASGSDGGAGILLLSSEEKRFSATLTLENCGHFSPPHGLNGSFVHTGLSEITDSAGMTSFVAEPDEGAFPGQNFFRARKLP